MHDLGAARVVTRSIHKPGTYTGIYPFDDNAAWARNAVHLRHLDAIVATARARKTRAREKKRG